MNTHLSTVPAAKFDEVMAGDYGQYCLTYELPFMQHLSLVIVALNRQEELSGYVSSPDPQQAVLDDLKREPADKPHNEKFTVQGVVALAYSLARTIQSMATYGRSISGLLEDVREKGDQEALFKAIRAVGRSLKEGVGGTRPDAVHVHPNAGDWCRADASRA